MKYRLIKQKNKVEAIIAPPIIDIKTNTDYSQVLAKKYGHIIEYFIKKITQIPNVDLTNLYNNIKTLKVETNKNKHKMAKMNKNGSYVADENTIYIYNIKSIYHELLHMASSIYDKKTDRRYIGLSQTFPKNGKLYGIGKGINEGYTDVLANRHFGKKIHSYLEQAKIASWIESVIGNEMMNYYFKADLLSLVNDLSEYDEIENIKNLLIKIDIVHRFIANGRIYNDEVPYFLETMKKIYTSLLQMVTLKWVNDFNNGLIDESTLTSTLKKYFDDCGTTVIPGFENYIYLTDLEKEQIIRETYETTVKQKGGKYEI